MNNAAGYTLTFCYKCEISPLGGLAAIPFTKDALVIRQYADCSDSLSALSPVFTAIPFKSGGSTIVKVTNYEVFFTHTKKTDCPLDSCTLMTAGSCGTPLS